MKQLLMHVKSEIETSADIAWDVAQDYSHFLFLHRKNFASFDVLFDDGALQTFFYISKPFPFLPFGKGFVSARRLDHANRSLDQVYQPVSGRHRDRVHFHFQVNPLSEGRVEWEGTYLYPLAGVLAAFPALFSRLFVQRIRRVWREDEEMLLTRHQLGEVENPVCEPYKNPVLAQHLLENLDSIQHLLSRKSDPDVLFFDFPNPPGQGR